MQDATSAPAEAAMRSLRPLGHMERYQLSKHLRHSAGPVAAAATFRLSPPAGAGGEVDLNLNKPAYWHRLLAVALDGLCAEHPMLSVVVAALSSCAPPSFAALPSSAVRVADVVECALDTPHWEADELGRALEAELQREFDVADHSRPLWRVRVLWHPERPDECCLCWVWDHVLADGLSGKFLLHSLVRRVLAAAQTAAQTEPTVDDAGHTIIRSFDFGSGEAAQLPGLPYDQRQPPVPSAWHLTKIVLKEKLLPAIGLGALVPAQPMYWAGQAAPLPEATHRTRIALVSAPPGLCATLRAEGKRRGASLHAITFTACATALRSAFDVPPAMSLKAATPISARRFCAPPVPASEVGNFIGSVETWLPLASSSSFPSSSEDEQGENVDQFWANCLAYGRHLSAGLRDGAAVTGLLAYVGDWPDAWTQLWRAKGDRNEATLRRAGSFEVSDLGRWEDCNTEDDQDAPVLSVTFGQSVHVNGEALVCSVACCETGGLRGTLAWQDGTLDEASVHRFARQFEALLHSLVSALEE